MIYIIAVAMVAGIALGLWCCLHKGKEEPEELRKREWPTMEPAHEYMDLRLPDSAEDRRRGGEAHEQQ